MTGIGNVLSRQLQTENPIITPRRFSQARRKVHRELLAVAVILGGPVTAHVLLRLCEGLSLRRAWFAVPDGAAREPHHTNESASFDYRIECGIAKR